MTGVIKRFIKASRNVESNKYIQGILDMLTYDIDEVITDMMAHEDTRLSAEASNTINFSKSTHPCGKGKSDFERIQTVAMAIVGRDVHPIFREKLDRLARRERNENRAAA